MENIESYLKLGFSEAKEDEKKFIQQLENPEYIKKYVAGSLLGVNERLSWYYLFVEKDVVKAKQCFYLYGKVNLYKRQFEDDFNHEAPMGMKSSIIYTLLSDSKNLIEGLANTPYTKEPYYLKSGALSIVIQHILKKEDQNALDLLDVFYAKHKKYDFKESDGNILKAIIKNDRAKIEEILHFLLLPKNHKKRNGIYPLRRDLLSFPALGFAKLAWLRGIEVDIDHPLLPKELLPINRNQEYFDTYDFLKENFLTQKQATKIKPNAQYRKDLPKNTIGITKNSIATLLVDHWEAKYTTEELQKYVDMIYMAFINPDEFDHSHYDFAKMCNCHIAYSDNEFIYLEERPFTNKWTVLKTEIDYFLEIIGIFFDFLDMEPLTDKEYEKLKEIFNKNQKKVNLWQKILGKR
jgi:hypothetical protein